MLCSIGTFVGLLLGCPGWQIVDWHYDIEATKEYWCMSINSTSDRNETITNQDVNYNRTTGQWYGPLAVANWFTTPMILMLFFYIYYDIMANTIWTRKYGLLGFGFFANEDYGGGTFVKLFGIDVSKFGWKNVICLLPMLAVNMVWLFLYNYIILWLATWHEWLMTVDEFFEELAV